MAISLYKVSRFFMVAIGLWKIPLSNKPVIQNVYRIYSAVVQGFFVSAILLMVIRTIELFGESEVEKMYGNIALIILLSQTVYKVLTYLKNGVPYMFANVIEKEESIMQHKDDYIRAIYVKHVRYYKVVIFCQCFCLGFCMSWFFLENFYRKYVRGLLPGEHFMYEIWFPFNEEKHDNIVTATNVIFPIISFCVHCASVTLLQTLMVFCTSRLRILQYQLKNVFKLDPDCADEESIKVAKVKELIAEHQSLIEFATALNNAIKNIILVEFGLESINGAGALLQLISVEKVSQIPYSLSYLILLFVNLNAMAWSANAIIEESVNIRDAIYESNWMDQSESIKKLLLIMLMRSRKPLSINVGPFMPMNTRAVLMTLKGTYSYASVMM